MTTENPLLSLQGISKSFGSLEVLRDLSFQAYSGEIHAVLGANGAGKSTLMNIISGFLTPDSGEGSFDGDPMIWGDPISMQNRGCRVLHQHFMLVPKFSVSENLALQSAVGMFRRTKTKEHLHSAQSLARQIGWGEIEDCTIESLPVGAQQKVELLKIMDPEAKLIILDEPTAVLAPQEVEDLFRVMRTLKENNVAVIFVAHKLSEVMDIADKITILRQGMIVSQTKRSDANPSQLTHDIVGHEIERVSLRENNPKFGDVAIDVKHLSIQGQAKEVRVNDVSFQVRFGEILGIGGVDGNGQLELAECLVGLIAPMSGSFEPMHSIEFIPQDRQRLGLALELSVQDNVSVSWLRNEELARGGIMDFTEIRRRCENLVQKFNIKTESVTVPVRLLSGGNQQKVILARALSNHPQVLVAMNPTRGLDVKSTSFVHDSLIEIANFGAAVLVFSTDSDELELLSDRIFFMGRGRLFHSLAEATA